MPGAYYMLMASLPHLPHFLRAERLPINPQRLGWRRSALDPADWQDMENALAFIRISHNQPSLSDAELDRRLGAAMGRIRSGALREYLDYWTGLRSALAGIRRKQRGLPPPGPGEMGGIGRWNRMLLANWDREDFGLAALYPCLLELRDLLAQGDALGVEKRINALLWFRLSRLQDEAPFAFQAVFAYVFKWEILARWLARDATAATQRFDKLIGEILHEQSITFA